MALNGLQSPPEWLPMELHHKLGAIIQELTRTPARGTEQRLKGHLFDLMADAIGLARPHLHRALNAFPGRLGVETIDLYQLHGSDMHTPAYETLSICRNKAPRFRYLIMSLSQNKTAR
jgi:hypothetical protein